MIEQDLLISIVHITKSKSKSNGTLGRGTTERDIYGALRPQIAQHRNAALV